MNEEKLNLSLRRFLKHVGINSQRIIENSIRKSIDNGVINTSRRVRVSITLEINELDIKEIIDGDIEVDI